MCCKPPHAVQHPGSPQLPAAENLRAQYRTKEQQAAHERKQLEEEFTVRLDDVQQRAELWQRRYTDSTIERALQDAAIGHEAFGLSQIIALLKPQTKMVEKTNEKGQVLSEFAPMVDFPDKDPDTGESGVTGAKRSGAPALFSWGFAALSHQPPTVVWMFPPLLYSDRFWVYLNG